MSEKAPAQQGDAAAAQVQVPAVDPEQAGDHGDQAGDRQELIELLRELSERAKVDAERANDRVCAIPHYPWKQ